MNNLAETNTEEHLLNKQILVNELNLEAVV